MAKQTLYVCDLCGKSSLEESEIDKLALPNLRLNNMEYRLAKGESCKDCSQKLMSLFENARVDNFPVELMPNEPKGEE